MENKLQNAQFGAWLLAAAIPAILSIIGRSSWITVLPIALICMAISSYVLAIPQTAIPRWLCIGELLWATVLLGRFAAESATCWVEADAFPAIPVVLLALSALAACNGGVRAGRTGAVLVWMILPVVGIVLLAGTVDAQWSWVRREMTAPDGMLTALLLLPCLGLFLPRDQGKKRYGFCIVIGLTAVISSVIVDAVLGGEKALSAPNTFYEFSKSVTLFSVAERFEALVACALTGGWFVLFAVILSAIYHLTEKIFPKLAKWSAWLCAIVAAGVMCILPTGTLWMGVGSLIFWGFLPAITQLLGSVKNIEKK